MRTIMMAVLLAVFAAAPMNAAAEDVVTGRNVTEVRAGPSSFEALPYRRWEERNADGAFSFEELYRDDASVLLYDASRKVRLQIDLGGAGVLYGEDAGALRPLYAVTSARAARSARNVTRVSVPTGVFRMTGPDAWIEQGFEGGAFRFAEQRRDGDSVYLVDPSRNVRLQIDLRRKAVFYADDGAPRMRRLYEITSFDAVD
ncbi:MAG: hypothetical protein JNJ73_02130 [Hyphomonadaceae bacterium]|nr:hypothetical protein [Hyphomonadaceae bacterium]